MAVVLASDLAAALTRASLRAWFDGATLGRAAPYADGAVSLLEIDVEQDEDEAGGPIAPGSGVALQVTADVAGTAPLPYEVDLGLELVPGPRGYELVALDTTCTCPVGWQCKHAAAVLIRLSRSSHLPPRPLGPGRQQSPTPVAVLEEALHALEGSRSHDPGEAALGLLFGLHDPPYSPPGHAAQPVVRLRPVRRGKRGQWVRSGVGWRDITPYAVHHGHDRHHISCLVKLRAALSSGTTSSYYWQPPDLPTLDDFGSELWPLLRRADGLGMPFVAGDNLDAVVLADDGVQPAVDVVRDDSGCQLRIGVRYAERWWQSGDLLLAGDEPSGVGLWDQGAGRLVLAPLRQPLDPPLVRLLQHGELHVSEAETAGFVGNQLVRLSRHVTVGSSDGSVVVPEPVAPRLALVVAWDRTPSAELTWEWRYQLGETTFACRVGSGDSAGGLRDRAAERAELDRIIVAGVLDASPASRTVPAGELLDLTIELARLEEAGIEVEQTDRPDFRPAVGRPQVSFSADDTADTDGSDRGRDWLDLAISVSVDGEQVPLATVLSALTRGHERILLPSGLHVSTDAPELHELRDLVSAASQLREDDDGERIRLGRHDLGLWASVGDLADVDVLPEHARDWVRRARALRDLTDLPDPEPHGLASELRHYQRDGFRWLAFLREHGLGGVLADDMGLGKTLQALALIARARADGAGPFLVVAPTSVVANWAAEAAQHTPGLTVRTVGASAARRTETLEALHGEADVVVTTYTLVRLEADDYAALAWGGLVLDEAQHVKNHLAKTHQAVRRIEAPFRLAVTGTPFENRLLELWALLAVVAPGLYPSVQDFQRNVVRPVEREGDSAALQRFRQRVRPFVLRRTKELVAADLPPKQEQLLEVELGARHRKIYDTHLARERQKILGLIDDFDRNRVAIFSALTRLRQLSLDPALVDPAHDRVGSAKADVLVEHLVELVSEGHRALVFSQFTGFLRRVRDRLDEEGVGYSYLDGRTRKRVEAIDAFRSGGVPVFLISLKAGGVGLTLTEADYVFVLDPWWNPAVEAQAVDRAHRIGQTKPVLVYRLVSRGTIEEKVVALKERKAELFAKVLDGDGELGSVVGADDVRALFA
ncbi:DEAD/DEAH box helicase [Nocardioides ferulae]|uniref:DEAD/DEAH box helicase n=1 Tax=Nocardioides ferulae TaxID=2340821 RepID=UPI0013DE4065|nr:DEAD/DEAH box helicase [Nocardioides ferulae]